MQSGVHKLRPSRVPVSWARGGAWMRRAQDAGDGGRETIGGGHGARRFRRGPRHALARADQLSHPGAAPPTLHWVLIAHGLDRTHRSELTRGAPSYTARLQMLSLDEAEEEPRGASRASSPAPGSEASDDPSEYYYEPFCAPPHAASSVANPAASCGCDLSVDESLRV